MDAITTITLPFAPPYVWGVLGVLGLALASVLVGGVLPRRQEGKTPIERAMAALSMQRLHPVVFVFGASVWLALTLLLIGGLFTVVAETIHFRIAGGDENFRPLATRVAALTAVLGAVIAFPITAARLRLQSETLFNQKITDAAADLYARRQRTIPRRGLKEQHAAYDIWEDDVARRNAAIDRLEGLVRERPDVAERVSRLLSVYVRELSAKDEVPATPVPEGLPMDELRGWAQKLSARSDMENAVQVLGRLRGISGVIAEEVRIDLRGANLQRMDFQRGAFDGAFLEGAQLQGAYLGEAKLQGADLSGAQLQGADLSGAQLQGADLSGAQLQGAYLFGAELQGANLSGAQLQRANLFGAELQRAYLFGAQLQRAYLSGAQLQRANLSGAQLQGADLSGAQLQGADLSGAQLQGAYLSGAQFDNATVLSAATLRGAALRTVDDTIIAQLRPFWQDVFADGSVQVPEEERPDHWSDEELDPREFREAWRAFQRSIGQDPDNPE